MADWRQYVDRDLQKKIDDEAARRAQAELKARQTRANAWSLASFAKPAAKTQKLVQAAGTPARPALLGGPPPRKP